MEMTAPLQSATVSQPATDPVYPPAVLGDPSHLTPAARKAIIALSGARPGRFFLEIVANWLAVAGLIALGLYADKILVTLLCIVLIGARQMAFGLLMHEQVHRLGMRSKYADWIVNALAVFPLGVVTIEGYAKVHLAHHKYFMTEKDPDYKRKSGAEWTFPMGLLSFAKVVARDLTGLNTVKLIKGKTAPADQDEFLRRNPTPTWFRLAFYTLAAALITLFDGWVVFLVYWVVPMLTTTQLFVRWTAVVEHQYNAPGATVHSITPLVELTWWQKLLFPDLNFSMHVYHHMHPGVSFSNLPKVHKIYKEEGLVDERAVFHGQGAFLRHIVKRS